MTYEFLQRINKRFANAFVYMQQQSILYTEYRGIFLFEGSQYRNQCLYYKPAKIHTTLRNAALLRYLSAGVHLKINSTHNVDIYFKDTVIKSCRGDNVSVCIF